MVRVLFLIPARGGSKGLPGKNTRALAGIPLVGHAARRALSAARVLGLEGHRVVCTSDDPAILAEASAWGAETPFARPASLAQDDSTTADVALHALDWLQERGDRFEVLVLLQPTTPLANADDVVGAFRLFQARPHDATAVVTVALAHAPQWNYRIEHGRLSPLVEGSTGANRRQDLVEAFQLNGAVYVINADQLRRTRTFVDPATTLASVMPAERSIDIDTLQDFACCEAVLAVRPVGAFHLGQRSIGPGSPCFVIAEAGVNHDGSVDVAHELVDAAADSGADAIKFQTFNVESLVSNDAPLAEYQRGSARSTQRELLQALTLPPSAYPELKRHAEQRGLCFLSSPFDERSADFLEDLGVPGFKLGSGELTNWPLLAHIARKRLPMLLSTGMSTMVEVTAAVDVVRAAGNAGLALLHCVSNYPASSADSNLRAIQTLRSAFQVPIGWSDHTVGNTASIAAVALGADLLERHITLDCSLPGPDHAASLEPASFKSFVDAVRDAARALGTGVKAPAPSELAIAQVARKSLHWRDALEVGTIVCEEHLVSLRPGTGIAPSAVVRVVGRRLVRPVQSGALVRDDDLGAP
jgi:N,N'-diacetyllegionaminate synthase